MSSVYTAVLLALITFIGGCSVITTEHTGADGSRTTTRSVRIAPTPVYVVPEYGTSDYRFYRGGYEYVAPYRIRLGEACRGSYGTVHNGICYPEKPYWMR